jgi:hypothetical protein
VWLSHVAVSFWDDEAVRQRHGRAVGVDATAGR